MDLETNIKELINSKREDDHWDFKEQWHDNKSDLLHDIICLANNRADRDAYLIFGVRDKTYEIIGIENDLNRKNQQKIIDFLKNIPFVSGIRPSIEVKTIMIENHELDILIVKNSYDTPYFLLKDYSDKGKIVKRYSIYTRVKDTNTPKDSIADINQIEFLWKKRFHLTSSPIIQFFYMIENKDEWEDRYDEKNQARVYHNIYRPEFTITLNFEDDEGNKMFYCFAQTDCRVFYGELIVKYFGTQLYSKQLINLDGRRFVTVALENSFFKLDGKRNYDYTYKFLIRNSEEDKLIRFLYNPDNSDERFAYQKHQKTYLEFDSEKQKEEFEMYLLSEKDKVIRNINQKVLEYLNYSIIRENTNEYSIKAIAQELATAEVFNEYFEVFRIL